MAKGCNVLFVFFKIALFLMHRWPHGSLIVAFINKEVKLISLHMFFYVIANLRIFA